MRRYLFSSHDGFGLGHTRRNSLIARAILDADPSAEVVLVTGVRSTPAWLQMPRLRVISVPGLVKQPGGGYRAEGMSGRAAIAQRAATVNELVATWRPDVVVVDRHPFGTFGELRQGLLRARIQGAALVLGLRDVLDDPGAVGAELGGGSWVGVREVFTDVLVYGSPEVCDHEREYGLPVTPTYTGWVAPAAVRRPVDDRRLVVAAGGGGDGASVFRLGTDLVRARVGWRATVLAGPYAAVDAEADERIDHVTDAPDILDVLARAGAVIQMAGYNSTMEALAAGLRPILLPRRSPRREQAIRAQRLASLGLADVVDADATAAEVAWLLDQPRRLDDDAIARAGLALDGARRAARHIASLTDAPVAA